MEHSLKFFFALKFFQCEPVTHYDEGSVVAHYSGPPPPPPASSAPPTVSAAPHVSKDETVMPTYGVALLVIVFVGTFVTLVGVFVHRRVQRERGFKWVHFDDHGNPSGNGAPGAGSAERGSGGQVEMNANGGSGDGANKV